MVSNTTITTQKRLLATMRKHRTPLRGNWYGSGTRIRVEWGIHLPLLYGGFTGVSARVADRLWAVGTLTEIRPRTHTALDEIVLGIRGVTCDRDYPPHMETPWCWRDDDATFVDHRKEDD